PQCLGPKLVRAAYEEGVPRRVRYVDHAQVPYGPRSPQCDSRFLSSWSILHGSTNHVFDFRLCYTVAIDVWLLRLRIDAVTNLHDGMLSPSAVSSNWIKTDTLVHVRITFTLSGRGAHREPRSVAAWSYEAG